MGVTQLPSTLVVLALVALAARCTPVPAGNPLTDRPAARRPLRGRPLRPHRHRPRPDPAPDPGRRPRRHRPGRGRRSRHRRGDRPASRRCRAGRGCGPWSSWSAWSPAASSAPAGTTAVPSPLAVAVAVVGAVALGSAAATMLRGTINDNARRLVNLAHRAASAEVSARHGQEKLHELNATVAGVAQASRLLVRDGGPTGAQRRRLESLLDTEMARPRADADPRAASSRSRTLPSTTCCCRWSRASGRSAPTCASGPRACGRRAGPTTSPRSLHILLSNVARHAPGAGVTIGSARCGNTVEIRVCDDGPGRSPRAPRLALRLGDTRSEVARPGHRPAAGQAADAGAGRQPHAREHDGRPGGATFVLTIPSSPPGLP